MNAAASKAPENIKEYVVKATPIVVAVMLYTLYIRYGDCCGT